MNQEEVFKRVRGLPIGPGEVYQLRPMSLFSRSKLHVRSRSFTYSETRINVIWYNSNGSRPYRFKSVSSNFYIRREKQEKEVKWVNLCYHEIYYQIRFESSIDL